MTGQRHAIPPHGTYRPGPAGIAFLPGDREAAITLGRWVRVGT